MRLIFNIDYHTNEGECVCISGNIPELGNGDTSKAVMLRPMGNGKNAIEVTISPAISAISYRYLIMRRDGTRREEWGSSRTISLDSRMLEATIFDIWQDQPHDKHFYTKAFTKCIFGRRFAETPKTIKADTIHVRVSAPTLLPGEVLAICGSNETLGNWNPENAIVMSDAEFPIWCVELPVVNFRGRNEEYKFLKLRKNDLTLLSWEEGANRKLQLPASNYSGAIVITEHQYNETASTKWRGAGVAIPVFSLRSNQGFGVGEFADIKPLADWAASTGQQIIQLLPINDTTMTHSWTDSYPYNANSCFALHPMYLRLQDMGRLNDVEQQARFEALAQDLNNLSEVDYERVNRFKGEFTRLLFAQQGEAEMTSTEFKKFVESNISWLKPYAAFCTLRDLHKTADTSAWERYAKYNPEYIDSFISSHQREINYVYYIQYHLDRQLRDACQYAHSLGIAIKGDIPIGISRNSVDAWTNPELFNLDSSAGAPPDDFSIMGQNWDFPTYNWDVMARDGYAWWKARFKKMSEYFDAYRIDHVLGFFRIWQIPRNALHGLLGVFNSAMPMSPEEMLHGFDFYFRREEFTAPYIVDTQINKIFGDLADEVRANYLIPIDNQRYQLRIEFSTQRQISNRFSNNMHDSRINRICNGLMSLIDDVLFIEDPYQKGKYHPRIAAQNTFIYQSLNDYEKAAFNKLYDDFYYHRHNDFWKEKAIAKLPSLIDATDMLCCAEDLGMIPACVPDVMSQYGILSLEIQRMPKDSSTEFAETDKYPYLSVCTTSTHDMPGIRQWWESDSQTTLRFYNDVIGNEGDAPYFAEPWICRRIVEMHLESPAMLCILPLQDWLSTDGTLRRQDPREEQINVPANTHHYWRYRMHISLEKLCSETQFNKSISDMIAKSER